ncbi:MAG: hypothetical protein JNM67_06905 [Bacteroidetes bacterium]|nr:hypothetical protein [Bacteroidota bacterium]
MKTKLTAIFIFTTCYTVYAQPLFTDFNQYPIQTLTDSNIRSMGISEIVDDVTYIYNRGKSYSTRSIYQYDLKGRSTFTCMFNDTTKPKRLNSWRLFNKSNVDDYNSISIYKQFNGQYIKIPYYNTDGFVSEILFFNLNGKIAHSYQLFYKDSNLVRYNHLDKHYKISSYYIYTYNGKKKTSSALYNSKGKLQMFWNFNCDESGTLTKLKSDTSKVCQVKSYNNDGTTITTTTYFAMGGKPIKQITHTDSHGRILKYFFYEGKNQMLTYRDERTYFNGVLVSKYYWNGNIKGKPFTSKMTKMDDQGRIVYQQDTFFYANNKFDAYRYEFAYNAMGLLIETKGYKKETLSIIRRYKYRYFR